MKTDPRRLLALVPLLVALSTTAFGNDRPSGRMKWWQSAEFQQQLSLTEDQSARIEEIFQATLPSLRASKAYLDRLETTLSQLVADATVDESQVAQQIDQVEAARSALSKIRTLMLFRMHRILSPEQRVKLKALHDQWHSERDNRPGGRDWTR